MKTSPQILIKECCGHRNQPPGRLACDRHHVPWPQRSRTQQPNRIQAVEIEQVRRSAVQDNAPGLHLVGTRIPFGESPRTTRESPKRMSFKLESKNVLPIAHRIGCDNRKEPTSVTNEVSLPGIRPRTGRRFAIYFASTERKSIRDKPSSEMDSPPGTIRSLCVGADRAVSNSTVQRTPGT